MLNYLEAILNNKQKRNLMRIILAAMMMAGFYFIEVEGTLRFYLYLIPYLVIGYDLSLIHI